ncbi:putative mediator complex subunit 28 [Tieghemostelium lacteum]|uniref:Putative mediator complex subunit 28 n=1 Tax=Tieghemostelium lacteum TaxID=361077 RepID=A0A152A8B5_TIELA|nr:putative mediator complex subunit 28 [Tieghemostelium lacteum]|eukprot:KYR02297.1 putative mediator complex subunit 28 [Tieghemostelium lacteum]
MISENVNEQDVNMSENVEQQQQQQQNEEESTILLQNLNMNLQEFLQMLIASNSNDSNQLDIDNRLNSQIDNFIGSAKDMELYFKEIQSKHKNEKSITEIKQEITKIKVEIENKDKLIEKYSKKVKEWKSHFEPLYKSQSTILHSTNQVPSSSEPSGTPHGNLQSPTPMGTPMPNTPSILSIMSQPSPSGF